MDKDGKSIQSPFTLGKKAPEQGEPAARRAEFWRAKAFPMAVTRNALAGNSQQGLIDQPDPLSEQRRSEAGPMAGQGFLQSGTAQGQIEVALTRTPTNSWKAQPGLQTGDWKLAGAKAAEKLDDAAA